MIWPKSLTCRVESSYNEKATLSYLVLLPLSLPGRARRLGISWLLFKACCTSQWFATQSQRSRLMWLHVKRDWWRRRLFCQHTFGRLEFGCAVSTSLGIRFNFSTLVLRCIVIASPHDNTENFPFDGDSHTFMVIFCKSWINTDKIDTRTNSIIIPHFLKSTINTFPFQQPFILSVVKGFGSASQNFSATFIISECKL